MTKNLNDIVSNKNYDAEATVASKAAIFTFIGTFIYEVFFTEASSGLIFGAMFLFIGMFITSIIVAMPLFILKKKFLSLTLIIDVLGFLLVVYLTHVVFQFLFS